MSASESKTADLITALVEMCTLDEKPSLVTLPADEKTKSVYHTLMSESSLTLSRDDLGFFFGVLLNFMSAVCLGEAREGSMTDKTCFQREQELMDHTRTVMMKHAEEVAPEAQLTSINAMGSVSLAVLPTSLKGWLGKIKNWHRLPAYVIAQVTRNEEAYQELTSWTHLFRELTQAKKKDSGSEAFTTHCYPTVTEWQKLPTLASYYQQEGHKLGRIFEWADDTKKCAKEWNHRDLTFVINTMWCPVSYQENESKWKELSTGVGIIARAALGGTMIHYCDLVNLWLYMDQEPKLRQLHASLNKAPEETTQTATNTAPKAAQDSSVEDTLQATTTVDS